MNSMPRQSQAQSAALALGRVRFTPEQAACVNQIVEARLAKARRLHQAEVEGLQAQVTQLQTALAARGTGYWSWWGRLWATVRRSTPALAQGVRP